MNTYLISGEIQYFIEKEVEKLKGNIDNIITFNMDSNTIDEVLQEAAYSSLFDDEKCIIVKNASFFSSSKNSDSQVNKNICDKLLKYLESENKKSKLIFIVDKVDSKKKIYNVLKDNGNVINIPSMTKTDMKKELAKIIKEEDYTCDDTILWYIINNSKNNFDMCIQELNKIFLYYSKPCRILYNDVLHLTSHTLEDNNFKLVDAIVTKNYDLSLSLLKELQVLKIEPSIIISLIYREFKLMLSIILLKEKNVNHRDIQKQLKLADWQFESINNHLSYYSLDEIKKQIVNLSNLDYKYKSGLQAKELLLINYIVDLVL